MTENKTIAKITNNTSRMEWLDYSKAVGILLVVIAHALEKDNLINIYSYSFHLPLFFLLGGVTIKENTFQLKFIDIIKKYARTIIIPYYFYAFFIVVIELLKNILQNDATYAATQDILLRWILMRGLKADWFLPCLFFSKIFFVGCFKTVKNRYARIVMVVIIAITCMLFPFKSQYLRCILCAGVGAFFVMAGYLMKNMITSYNNYVRPMPALVIFVIWVVLTHINGKVSLLIYNFGENMILYIVNGVLGSLLVIMFTKWIENKFGYISVMSWIGKNSMIIMVVHMEIMAFVSAIISRINFFGNNQFLLKSSIIIITLVISVAITPVVDKCYNFIFNRKEKVA